MNQPSGRRRREWVLSVLDEYEARLTRYAARVLGDEHAAQDVVQFAFLKLCEQSPEELDGRVGRWMYTVCRNRAFDMIRASGRTIEWDRTEAVGAAGHEPDPADSAQREELYDQLAQRVAELPQAQREAVDLWAEGFTYREIAEMTGQREGNLRVLVHRAIKRLRADPATQRLMDHSDATAGNGQRVSSLHREESYRN